MSVNTVYDDVVSGVYEAEEAEVEEYAAVEEAVLEEAVEVVEVDAEPEAEAEATAYAEAEGEAVEGEVAEGEAVEAEVAEGEGEAAAAEEYVEEVAVEGGEAVDAEMGTEEAVVDEYATVEEVAMEDTVEVVELEAEQAPEAEAEDQAEAAAEPEAAEAEVEAEAEAAAAEGEGEPEDAAVAADAEEAAAEGAEAADVELVETTEEAAGEEVPAEEGLGEEAIGVEDVAVLEEEEAPQTDPSGVLQEVTKTVTREADFLAKCREELAASAAAAPPAPAAPKAPGVALLRHPGSAESLEYEEDLDEFSSVGSSGGKGTKGKGVITGQGPATGSAAPGAKGGETGYIFVCTRSTQQKCQAHQLLGSPDWELSQMQRCIRCDGSTLIFLLNLESQMILGPFHPVGLPRRAIVPAAFGGKFTAQVRVAPAGEVLWEAKLDTKLRGGPKTPAEVEDLRRILARGTPLSPEAVKAWSASKGAGGGAPPWAAQSGKGPAAPPAPAPGHLGKGQIHASLGLGGKNGKRPGVEDGPEAKRHKPEVVVAKAPAAKPVAAAAAVAATLAVGETVRLLSGEFKGRTGEVAAIDGEDVSVLVGSEDVVAVPATQLARCPAAGQGADVAADLAAKREELRQIVMRPEHIQSFLQNGRIVYMRDKFRDWGWGILISKAQGPLQLQLRVFLPIPPGAPGRTMANGQPAAKIFTLPLAALQRVSKVRANMPTGDLDSEESRTTMLQNLEKVKNHPSFQDGIPELDPVTELRIKDPHLAPLLEEIASLEQAAASA